MKDWKTTITGLIAGLAMVAKTFGLDIPDEVSNGITAVAVFAMAFFAKDKG